MLEKYYRQPGVDFKKTLDETLALAPRLVPLVADQYWLSALLTPFLVKAGPEVNARLRKRVVDELTTTFASHYSHEVSLVEALSLDVINNYNAKRTGEKYLIRP
mgnify:CR=1 FL=1